uniref:RNA exonuclease 4 n=1 Tax=Clastoptera arizonana TaxID=38151 RepID=A0A1B6CVV7_9HEMI
MDCSDIYTEKLSDMKLVPKQSPSNSKFKYADITHKRSNGSNNWAKFKESEKTVLISSIKPKANTSMDKINKSSLNNSFNSIQIKPLYGKHYVHNLKPTYNKPIVKPNPVNKRLFDSVTPSTKKSKANNPKPCNTIAQLRISSKPQENASNMSESILINCKNKAFQNFNSKKRCSNPFSKNNDNSNPYFTKCVAIDCEMVGVDEDAKSNMLARVSIVNSFGDCVYDKFVKPIEEVVDYRTKVSGIRPENLENGEDFAKVQKEVAEILKGRTLIGHALKHDLSVLFLTHPRVAIRDTSKYKKLCEGFKTTPSLKKLTAKYLGVNIQNDEHCSIEDAKAAMMLYMMFRKDWETEIKQKRYKKVFTKVNPAKNNTHIMCDDI